MAIIDARGNLLRSDGPTLCVLGDENLIVVATADAIIEPPRERAQEVKDLRSAARDL